MKIQEEKKRAYLPPATTLYQAEAMSFLASSDPVLEIDETEFIDDEEEII